MQLSDRTLTAISNSKKKAIIILGSGIHSQAFETRNNSLSNWSIMLKNLDPNYDLSDNYLLDFENIIRRKAIKKKTKNASQIESELLKQIAQIIAAIDVNPLKDKYPLDIFNSAYVSDVISLNFDTIPERLLSGKTSLKPQYHEWKTKEKLSEEERNALLYHEAGGIRFWHPHGSVEKPSSIQLGLRKYGLRVQVVEKLRKHYKSKSRDGKNEHITNPNWYDLLTTRPIIICGASLSHAEWDIWTALVNRSRNYARYPKHQQPIYIMTDNPGMYEARNKDNVNYFIPITSKKESFAAQWKKLEQLFSK